MTPRCQQLSALIRQRIEAAGGWLPFDQFMQAALYEPELGYYETSKVFGRQGDFVTAAQMGPWLSLGLLDLLVWGWQQLGAPNEWHLVEQGGGEGALLATLAGHLQQLELPAPKLWSVERSAGMRRRQQQRYAEAGLLVTQVPVLADLPLLHDAILFSNELPDAFPVRCFAWRDGEMLERGVAVAGDTFAWVERTLAPLERPAIDPALMAAWPEGYISEWSPRLADWQAQLAAKIERGLIVTVDYGYNQREFYRSGRGEGTLLAHLGHRTSDDLLSDPGSRDLTAHVDFSALLAAGECCRLEGVLFCTQGAWLAQSPSVSATAQSFAMQGGAAAIAHLAEAKRLMLPFGMGEIFKLLVQSRGCSPVVPAWLGQFEKLKTVLSP